MPIIPLLVLVLIAAFVLWAIANYVAPAVPAPWGNIILAVVAIIFIVWLLQTAGLLNGLRGI